MKKHVMIAAVSLAIAAPAAVQPAPTPAHQDHQRHEGHGEGQAPDRPGPSHQGMADGCCADRNNNGRMDCYESMVEGQACCCAARPAGERSQAGHGDYD